MPSPARTLITSGRRPLTAAQAAAVRAWIRMSAEYGHPAGECQINVEPSTSAGEPAWTVTGPQDCEPAITAKAIKDAIEAA